MYKSSLERLMASRVHRFQSPCNIHAFGSTTFFFPSLFFFSIAFTSKLHYPSLYRRGFIIRMPSWQGCYLDDKCREEQVCLEIPLIYVFEYRGEKRECEKMEAFWQVKQTASTFLMNLDFTDTNTGHLSPCSIAALCSIRHFINL